MKIFLISHEEKTTSEGMANRFMNAEISNGQLQVGITDIYFVHEPQNSVTSSDFTISSHLPNFSFIFNEECTKTCNVDVLKYFVLYFIKREIYTHVLKGKIASCREFTYFFGKAVLY